MPYTPVSYGIFELSSRESDASAKQMPFEEHKVLVNKLCKQLWPSAPTSSFTIEQLKDGAHSRIIGITKRVPHSGLPCEEFILKIPHPGLASNVEGGVAVLRYVGQNTDLPVARVIKSDFTDKNALGSPYVLQSRVPGVNLHSIMKGHGLTDEQRSTIARQLGRILLQLQKVTSSQPGIIKESAGSAFADGFGLDPLEVGLSPFDRGQAEPRRTACPVTYTSVMHWFDFRFHDWRKVHLESDSDSYFDRNYYLDQLSDISLEMGEMGFFKNEYCLCHLQLRPSNIMVEVSKHGEVSISGILDWDSAVMAPKFVSYTPPAFLWEKEYVDSDGFTCASFISGPPDADSDRAVQSAFNKTVDQEFFDYAYKYKFRMARRLFNFALTGVHTKEHTKSASHLITWWKSTCADPKWPNRRNRRY